MYHTLTPHKHEVMRDTYELVHIHTCTSGVCQVRQGVRQGVLWVLRLLGESHQAQGCQSTLCHANAQAGMGAGKDSGCCFCFLQSPPQASL